MPDEYSTRRDPDGTLHLLVNGEIHGRLYGMREALEKIGITAATYYRWVAAGTIEDVRFRNNAQWRLFTEADIERVRKVATRVIVVPTTPPGSAVSGKRK